MAQKKSEQNSDVFVSFEPMTLRDQKVKILQAQAHTLRAMKHATNLAMLSRQRNELKMHMYGMVRTAMGQVKLLDQEFPKPNIPKRHRKVPVESQEEEQETKVKTDWTKREEIDKELLMIRQRLARLNA